jgi:hypothetical protein
VQSVPRISTSRLASRLALTCCRRELYAGSSFNCWPDFVSCDVQRRIMAQIFEMFSSPRHLFRWELRCIPLSFLLPLLPPTPLREMGEEMAVEARSQPWPGAETPRYRAPARPRSAQALPMFALPTLFLNMILCRTGRQFPSAFCARCWQAWGGFSKQ